MGIERFWCVWYVHFFRVIKWLQKNVCFQCLEAKSKKNKNNFSSFTYNNTQADTNTYHYTTSQMINDVRIYALRTLR